MHRAKLSTEPLGDEVAKSLEAYARNNRFERAVRHKMATSLTSGELQKWRNMFEELDTEDTGEIPIAELVKELQKEGSAGLQVGTPASQRCRARTYLESLPHALTPAPPPPQFDATLLASLDMDGDGTIDWKEFVAACIEDHALHNEENLEAVFKSLDSDKSGALSQTEIAEHFGNDHKLSKEIIEKLRAQRASQGEGASLESKGMTLTEFKSLLIDGTSTRSTRKRTKTRKKDRNPPRPDQTVQSV